MTSRSDLRRWLAGELSAEVFVKRQLESNQAKIDRAIQWASEELDRGPAPGETFDQLAERLVLRVAAAVKRYSALFPRPGRTKKIRITRSRRPRGRPAIYDSAEILTRVDAHRALALRQRGRRLRRGTALCELLADALRVKAERRQPGFQAKYHKFQLWRPKYEEDFAPSTALRKALMRVEGKHLVKLERLLSYRVTGRPRRK